MVVGHHLPSDNSAGIPPPLGDSVPDSDTARNRPRTVHAPGMWPQRGGVREAWTLRAITARDEHRAGRLSAPESARDGPALVRTWPRARAAVCGDPGALWRGAGSAMTDITQHRSPYGQLSCR